MNKNTVLFISDYPGGREQKIATGLKRSGWNIILLCSNKPLFSNFETFSRVIHYTSVSDILSLCVKISPRICHIFTYYNYSCACHLINHLKHIPVILDPYDIIFEMFTDDFLNNNKHHKNNIQLEKYCLEQADGICCRHLETQIYKRKSDIKLKSRVLIFDGCLPTDINLKNDIKNKRDIHIVYSGSVAIEKLRPELNGSEGFLWLAKKIIAADMHFHLYPAQLVFRNFEEDFSDYHDLEKSSGGKFHIHKPVSYDNLITEISKYDIAVLGPLYNVKSVTRTHYPLKYGMANKLFDYIEAGLPIISDPSYKISAYYTKKLKIDIPFDDLLYSEETKFLEQFLTAKKHVSNASEYFDVFKQASRLSDFYHKIIAEKKSAETSLAQVNIKEVQASKVTILNEPQYPKEFTRLVPEIFAVETILGCDLKCPECAVGGDFVTRKKGWMQFDQFKIIADKIRPFCKHLYLHIWGEPMLNKDIFEMIEYASAFTITNISTNGKSMTEEKAERLIKSGVTDIIVSIDGVSQEVYEKYRVGGDVEKATEALRMLQHFNLKYGNKVHIMPQFIVMKHNHHEMNAFRNLSESLGLRPLFKSPYIRDPNSHFSASDDPRFQRPYYPDVASLRAAMCECDSVRKAFNILVDGSVVACCHDYNNFTHFGNIFEQDVLEIWNSEKYKKFRWNVMSGKAPKFCKERCMSYFLEHPEQALPEQALIDEHKDQVLAENPSKTELHEEDGLKINLCSGSIKLEGYVNIDIFPGSDIILDLEKDLLPFPDSSADIVACISAINYFSRQRALEIIKDVHRVLKPGGIARFGTQDLHILAEEYLKKDSEFYSQKLPDGRDRFPGKTIGDKFNEFFYGFQSGNKHCKYVYDFESLKILFEEAGFSLIEQKNYQESLIPQVEQLDNRPEQMFFLEAIKDKTDSAVSNAEITRILNKIKSSIHEKTEPSVLDSMRNQAFRLWETSEKERAWQLLLKVLELHLDDRRTVLKCTKILSNLNKSEDLLKLCTDFLNLKPDDAEIRKIAENTQNQVKENSPDSNRLEQRRLESRKFNEFFNAVHADEMHLAACMQWLIKAQDVNPGGGVSAAYHIDSQRWDVDYPETTGYIIPTFLCYSKLTRDASYRKRAIDMGDWEIAIQSPEGGAGEPVGVYGHRPRVFNTGQVIIGWVALYAETGDQKYLQAAQKAADWIVENQDPDGKWTKSTYSGPKAYKSRVAWALLELYGVNKDEEYRVAVERSINWIFSQASANAWFANNSLSDPGKPWTHLIGYVLVGLMEIYRLNINNPQFKNVLNLLHHAAKNISTFYAKLKEGTQQGYFSTLPGTLDSNWSSTDNWSCVTGNAQIEFFLRRMFRYTNDPSLKSSADMLLNDLKMIHLLDGITDPNISGGLAGSCPVGGPYLGYSIPNWGVKFFADSLLQRLLPEQEQNYLG